MRLFVNSVTVFLNVLTHDFHMVPALISAYGDAHLHRVSAEAAFALALFCEAAPQVSVYQIS